MTGPELTTVTAPELASPEVRRHLRRLEAARVWLQAATAVFSLAALIVAGVLLYQLGDVAKTNKSNGEVIRGCVEQGGACYEENRRRTAESFRQLTRLMVAVEVCGQRNRDEAALTACVARATG